MKIFSFFTAVCFLFIAGLICTPVVSAQPVTEIKSAPSDVTVFSGWALVKRELKINASAGEGVYAVSDLPQRVVHNSISVSKEDKDAPVLVKEYEYQDVISESVVSPEEKKIRDRIELLKISLKSKDDRISVLDQQIKFYASISAKAADDASKTAGTASFSAESIGQAVKFITTGTENAVKEKRGIEREIVKLKEEIAVAESQAASVSKTGVRPQKALFITLNTPAAGPVKLIVSYVVPGVSWQPSYETDFISAKNRVEGRYNAVIRQNSGEDWKGVKLRIAAGTPVFDVTIPQAKPWIVSEYKPPVVYKQAPASRAMMMAAPSAEAYDEVSEASGIAYDTSVESVSETGAGIDITLSGRYTIQGGNSERKVFIKNIKFGTGDMSYLAVPSQNEYAYLTAEFVNEDDIPLVPGEISIYMDGSYSGKARIDRRISKGEKASFSFGIDERIKITKEKLWQKKGESGMFGGNEVTDFAFRIKAENFRAKEVKLTIKEPLPVPSHDKIKVDIYEAEPVVTKRDEKGIAEWEINLKPLGKTEVNYKFRIIHPKDMQVIGY